MVDQRAIIDAGIKALGVLHYNIEMILAHEPIFERTLEVQYMFVSSARVAEAIFSIAHTYHRAYACLLDAGSRAGEGAASKALRLERVSEFRRMCEGISLKELSNRGFRNSMAHFDERLLKMATEGKQHLVENLGVSHRAGIADGFILINVYFYDVDELHLFEDILHLRQLKCEVEQIVAILGLSIDRSSLPQRPHYVPKSWPDKQG